MVKTTDQMNMIQYGDKYKYHRIIDINMYHHININMDHDINGYFHGIMVCWYGDRSGAIKKLPSGKLT